MERIKFEYVFALILVIGLFGALFVFKDNKEIVNTILTAIVGALSSITAFLFTKTQIK